MFHPWKSHKFQNQLPLKLRLDFEASQYLLSYIFDEVTQLYSKRGDKIIIGPAAAREAVR